MPSVATQRYIVQYSIRGAIGHNYIDSFLLRAPRVVSEVWLQTVEIAPKAKKERAIIRSMQRRLD
jgi:hypothetical protein